MGYAFSVFKRSDCYIVTSVGQHIQIGFKLTGGDTAYRHKFAADRFVCKIKSKSIRHIGCVVSVSFKEIAYLIQHYGIGIVVLNSAVLILLNKLHKAVLALQTGCRILQRAIHKFHIPVIRSCDFKRLSLQIDLITHFICDSK